MIGNKLFIPTKIKVGFQNRNDTFTQKLGYVIPLGERGEYRKLPSWNSWRDNKIEPVEIDNTPTINFVLNKGVQRYGYWRGSGRSVVRLYDPRDFEFEITVENLMFLLMHADVSKRDITQECVYAWDKDKLILLPTNSQEYQEAIGFTEEQYKKVSTKTLVPGAVYKAKKTETEYTYIGFYEWFAWVSEYPGDSTSVYTQSSKGKKHVFWDGREFVCPSMGVLSGRINEDELNPEFAALVEKFFGTISGSRIASMSVGVSDRDDQKRYTVLLAKEEAGTLYTSRHYFGQRDKPFGITNRNWSTWKIIDGNFVQTDRSNTQFRYSYGWDHAKSNPEKYIAYVSSVTEENLQEVFDTHGVGELQYTLSNGRITTT